jgi:hypothetical protein
MEETKKFKLSDQFLGCVMMALQKGLIEQVDITDLLRGFEVVEEDYGLVVLNPPSFEVPKEEETK